MSAKPNQAEIEEVKQHLYRYQNLRRHREPNSTFSRNLERFQLWQQERMRSTHEALFTEAKQQEMMEFFFNEMYMGLDMSRLGKSLDKAVTLAFKLVSNTQLIKAVIEFNTLTGELDETITACIFEKLGHDDVTNDAYIEANRIENTYEDRLRQIELILMLSQDLDKNTKSRVVYGAFKMAKAPAKLGGLGEFYDTMMRGYQTLRSINSPEVLISELMEHEQRINDRIFNGHPDPLIVS